MKAADEGSGIAVAVRVDPNTKTFSDPAAVPSAPENAMIGRTNAVPAGAVAECVKLKPLPALNGKSDSVELEI